MSLALLLLAASASADPVHNGYIIIHNEPIDVDVGAHSRPKNASGGINQAYPMAHWGSLEDTVDAAAVEGHKVAIFFTPQWMKYVVDNDAIAHTVADWVEAGHELGYHHHPPSASKGDYTGNTWDGYTNLGEWTVRIEPTAARVASCTGERNCAGGLCDYTCDPATDTWFIGDMSAMEDLIVRFLKAVNTRLDDFEDEAKMVSGTISSDGDIAGWPVPDGDCTYCYPGGGGTDPKVESDYFDFAYSLNGALDDYLSEASNGKLYANHYNTDPDAEAELKLWSGAIGLLTQDSQLHTLSDAIAASDEDRDLIGVVVHARQWGDDQAASLTAVSDMLDLLANGDASFGTDGFGGPDFVGFAAETPDTLIASAFDGYDFYGAVDPDYTQAPSGDFWEIEVDVVLWGASCVLVAEDTNGLTLYSREVSANGVYPVPHLWPDGADYSLDLVGPGCSVASSTDASGTISADVSATLSL